MPIPKPDGWDDAKEGFDPIPPGIYEVEVTDATEGVAGPDAKYPGKPKINLEMSVLDEEYEGRRLWLNLSFTDKSIGIVKSNLRALGYPVDDVEEIEADELVGLKAKAVVSVGENPKLKQPNNSVKRLISLEESMSELPG